MGKEEIAQQAISPFPTVFSTCLESFLPFSVGKSLKFVLWKRVNTLEEFVHFSVNHIWFALHGKGCLLEVLFLISLRDPSKLI